MDTPRTLRNKKIILGITGCIAAYKSAELLRLLQKSGADVWTVMTRSAQEFITPLTFRTLSGNPCITDMFNKDNASMPLPHISLTDDADLLLVVPATADIIGKAASGIADDILSTMIMSCGCPVVFAPAMNTRMWNNKILKDNISKLKKNGSKFIAPCVGELACGTTGEGHLAHLDEIMKTVNDLIGTKQDLAGKKVLVTAGGTRESIDPVRFIGNRSSGKMGFALARAASDRGADVTLISANSCLEMPEGVEPVNVSDSSSMRAEVEKHFDNSDILVMAAAVSDYTPSSLSADKIKKDGKDRTLELVPTKDILGTVASKKGKRIVVGYSVESRDLLANSKKKLKEKGLDLIVANGVSAFESDSSEAVILSKDNKQKKLAKADKYVIANAVLDAALEAGQGR